MTDYTVMVLWQRKVFNPFLHKIDIFRRNVCKHLRHCLVRTDPVRYCTGYVCNADSFWVNVNFAEITRICRYHLTEEFVTYIIKFGLF